MIRELLFTGGICALGFALRSWGGAIPRKSGALAILAGTFLAAYFIGGHSVLAGTLATMVWFLLPWIEILGRIRRLRLPIHREFSECREPPRTEFPHLGQITREIEQLGFQQHEDFGWEFDAFSQFLRLFIAPDGKTTAALTFNRHGTHAFVYVALTTRPRDGSIWRTTNLPFSETMALPPRVTVNRELDAESFADLVASHARFLAREEVSLQHCAPLDPDILAAQIEADAKVQVDHNIRCGLIAPADDVTFRYSWRGYVFLWWRFVGDMIRLA